MRSLAAAGLLLVAAGASAQKLDHAGQIGLRAAFVGEYLNLISTLSTNNGGSSTSYSALTGAFELGPTAWIDDEGDEVSVRARWIPEPTQHCESGACNTGTPFSNTLTFLAGFRKLVGREDIKTFIDADVALSVAPQWLGGLHLDAGVLWDPLRNVGAYASIGVLAEAGRNFRFRMEGTVGLQVRFDVAAE